MKYRFKDALEFEANRRAGPTRVGLDIDGEYHSIPLRLLEEVESELSESERLPNGTVVRSTIAGRELEYQSVAKKSGEEWFEVGKAWYGNRVSWVDSGNYEILSPKAKTPGTFDAGDPEPGPEVTHVMDVEGDIWRHAGEEWRWDYGAENWRVLSDGSLAPLIDVSADYA